jgi:peroxiredoxin family protein
MNYALKKKGNVHLICCKVKIDLFNGYLFVDSVRRVIILLSMFLKK